MKTLKTTITFLILFAVGSAFNLQAQTDSDMPSTTVTVVPLERQTDELLTQYWAMPTLYNPAATGDIDYVRIRGGARLEWLGMHQSPKNYLVTADSPFKLLGKRIGAGVVLNSRSYGLFQNLLIGAQGSYKLRFGKNNFSIGLQIGYYTSKYKGSERRLGNLGGESGGSSSPEIPGDTPGNDGAGGVEGEDPEEPDDDPYYNELPTEDINAGVFDLGFGVRYEHPKFYVGLAGRHLTNPTLKMTREGETAGDSRYFESKLPATLYFDAGGNIPVKNSLISLQPSVIVATDFTDFTGVLDLRATYNQKITFGIDYRWNHAAGVMAGLMLKNFFVGYSWEYDWTAPDKGSTGNHELVLGYQFKLDMGGKNMFSHRSIRIM